MSMRVDALAFEPSPAQSEVLQRVSDLQDGRWAGRFPQRSTDEYREMARMRELNRQGSDTHFAAAVVAEDTHGHERKSPGSAASATHAVVSPITKLEPVSAVPVQSDAAPMETRPSPAQSALQLLLQGALQRAVEELGYASATASVG